MCGRVHVGFTSFHRSLSLSPVVNPVLKVQTRGQSSLPLCSSLSVPSLHPPRSSPQSVISVSVALCDFYCSGAILSSVSECRRAGVPQQGSPLHGRLMRGAQTAQQELRDKRARGGRNTERQIWESERSLTRSGVWS